MREKSGRGQRLRCGETEEGRRTGRCSLLMFPHIESLKGKFGPTDK